jgi:tetratricopeptide (TPR) repeat protein
MGGQQTARSAGVGLARCSSCRCRAGVCGLGWRTWRLFYAGQDWPRAIHHLEQAARGLPEFYTVVSSIYRSQDQPGRAREAAERGLRHFRRLAQAAPNQQQYRLQWGICALLADDHEAAIDVLKPIADRTDDKSNEAVREALAAAYLGRFRELLTSGGPVQQLETLDRALFYGPEDPRVLAVVGQLAGHRTTTGEQADVHAELDAALQQALADGVAPAVGHLVLGLRRLEGASAAGALNHLELACRSNPEIPLVLNQLAVLLADGQRPDLPRAVAVIEAAGRLTRDPRIDATRAMLLDRLPTN